SFIKCKKVIKSVLVFEIYEMISKINIVIIIIFITNIITKQFDLFNIFIIVYMNSYFSYDYLIKLKTTNKKRFIINIIILKQLYERRKL
ncbi:hypothetical protein BDZ45DRAFT_590097, partial [Acephala macrosclerotiorum]